MSNFPLDMPFLMFMCCHMLQLTGGETLFQLMCSKLLYIFFSLYVAGLIAYMQYSAS